MFGGVHVKRVEAYRFSVYVTRRQLIDLVLAFAEGVGLGDLMSMSEEVHLERDALGDCSM